MTVKTTTFAERGEPKRNRTEVLLLTSLTAYRWAKLFTLCIQLVGCCFTSTETVGLLGTGAQDGHLDFHTTPELYVLSDNDDGVKLNVLGCRLTY